MLHILVCNCRYPTSERYNVVIDAIFREFPDIPLHEGLDASNSRVCSFLYVFFFGVLTPLSTIFQLYRSDQF